MQRTSLEGAAANYSYLRGLFYIPLGLVFILAALANWEVGPLRHLWTFPLAVALVGAACLPISRYYNEHYGRLRPSTAQQIRAGAATLLALVVVGGGSALLRSDAGWSLDLPVNATAVTLALVMLISYGVGVGLKRHHVLICGTLLVIGALPVWSSSDPSNVGLVLAGVAVMLSGVFDHRLFVETFGPPHVVDLEERDVRA
jgi:hypothetical protein